MARRKSKRISLIDIIIKGMEEKKAENIILLDLASIDNTVSDMFVVCHGNSNTQVKAISEAIVSCTKKEFGEKPWHNEGNENSEWVLLDYVNVVAHVFNKSAREYYDIEGMWSDVEIKGKTNSLYAK